MFNQLNAFQATKFSDKRFKSRGAGNALKLVQMKQTAFNFKTKLPVDDTRHGESEKKLAQILKLQIKQTHAPFKYI